MGIIFDTSYYHPYTEDMGPVLFVISYTNDFIHSFYLSGTYRHLHFPSIIIINKFLFLGFCYMSQR